MRDFLIILLNWHEVAELLHDVGHGLCAVNDPHHVHADNHERNIRNRAVAIFNKRGLTTRAADGAIATCPNCSDDLFRCPACQEAYLARNTANA